MLGALVRSGRLRWDAIPEPGGILAGTVPGHTGDGAVTLFRDSQGGFGDVAVTRAIYARALERGPGTQIEL